MAVKKGYKNVDKLLQLDTKESISFLSKVCLSNFSEHSQQRCMKKGEVMHNDLLVAIFEEARTSTPFR